MGSIYWIDSGVLISSHRGLYAPELVPGFWNFIETNLKSGTIRMPKVCFDEITDGSDWLVGWCKDRRTIGYFCVKSSAHKDVHRCMTIVSDHVVATYSGPSAADFLKGGDPWVIAYAMATGGFVVTEELRNTYKTKVKIPTVAKQLRVPWKATHEMCRELKAKF